ncbi:MAG TPA: hypothetical protein PK530_16120, partial [Anaerolineales bacterium]|nr:hypothetical protein [Anaerolineales bacterium]
MFAFLESHVFSGPHLSPCQMLEDEWDHFTDVLTCLNPSPVPPSPVRLVLSDAVPPQFRGRKASTEFPISLDSLETYLHRVGLTNTDYTFLPTQATQAEMKQQNAPLVTLGVRGQVRTPVREAHIWGINLMNYLQAPALFTLLDLAQIPAHRAARGAEHPLIVLGGHIWPNPLPLASFYDVLVLGDGEPVLADIANLIAERGPARAGLLPAIAEIPGTYVPGYSSGPLHRVEIPFHEPVYLTGSSYLLNGVGALVISRGCPYDCAFCNNRHVGGQYRVKPFSQVVAQIDRFKQTGAQKIMLLAASASSYRSEGKTLDDILAYLHESGLSARTMSDRPEHFTDALVRESGAEKGKVILAPEASPRLRHQVLRKTMREVTLQRAIRQIIAAGINYIQLYVIVSIPPIRPGVVSFLPDGHPGETQADLRYLAELGVSIANQMHQAGLHPPPDKPFVKMDCMPFIPAIGTQLQKLAFSSYPAYQERLARLREMIPPEYASEVEISAAMDETTHLLQAFMERNTAQAGEVLWETWRGAPAGILTAPLLRDALARAGFDLDQLREEYFRKPLPY